MFVVILALSNLGTSYATAMLAKDATTNDKNELVDKHTGETLGTDQAVSRFNAQEPPTEEFFERDLQSQVSYAATSSDFTEMTEADALKLLKFCAMKNKVVVLTFTFNDGQVASRTVCSPTWSCTSTFNGSPNPTEGTLCLEGTTPAQELWVQKQNTGVYTVSGTELSYANPTPDQVEYLTGDIGDPCHESEDCDNGLECTSVSTKELDDVGTCRTPVMGEGMLCSIDKYMCDTSQGQICSPRFVASDIRAAEACGRDFSCSNENDYCNIDSDGNGVCSSCDLADHTTCANDIRPTCITISGNFATCGCSDDSECSDGQTCGIPSTNCIADVFHYCSVDHNDDFGCVQVGEEAVWQASEGICVVATVADELVCDTDTYDCGCGTVVPRDPANNCEFPMCPAFMCTMEVRYCDDGSTASRNECCDFICDDGTIFS